MTDLTHARVVAPTARRSTVAEALRRLTATDSTGTSSLLLRLVLAIVIWPHGAQKVLGWFGGYGIEGTLDYFTGTLGIPAALAILVFAAEFLGPIGLALGASGRVAAAGVIAVMIGAIVTTHLPHGFFMNWDGTRAGEGFEYHLLVIGISLALLVAGSGRWSFDAWLHRRLTRR